MAVDEPPVRVTVVVLVVAVAFWTAVAVDEPPVSVTVVVLVVATAFWTAVAVLDPPVNVTVVVLVVAVASVPLWFLSASMRPMVTSVAPGDDTV